MNIEKELSGFMGSREQVVLSAYLEALDTEARDRLIAAKCLVPGGMTADKSGGLCLVEVAEPWVFWSRSPVALKVGTLHEFEIPEYAVPLTFDASAQTHGEPFIRWLKAECARLNGSSPQDIANLSTPTLEERHANREA